LNNFIIILKHDLHKLKIGSYVPHSKALTEKLMRKADAIASWFSRNSGKQNFKKENRFYIRKSHISYLGEGSIKNDLNKYKLEVSEIFREPDPVKLHKKILASTILNLFSEALQFPYTSFKYHLLLTCAVYYCFYHNYNWQQLYICENIEPESQFQIIYKDKDREWALTPKSHKSMSRVSPKFFLTWERRTQNSIGGVNRFLDSLLSQIGSWSEALATIEDFRKVGYI